MGNATTSLSTFDRFRQLSPEEMTAAIKTGERAPATTRERARIFLMLGRPRTCVPGMIAFALGLAYVQPSFSVQIIVGAVLCFLGGFVANIGNTYTDLAEDCRNLPGRVYLLAKLGYRHLFWLLMATYAAMVIAAASFGIAATILMVIALVLVHEYSFGPIRAKDGAIAGLIVFAQVVAFPFFVACFCDPDRVLWNALIGAEGATAADIYQSQRFVGMLLFVEVWFIAKGFFKNIPDYYGDKAAGIRTSATVFSSWRGAAIVAAVVTTAAYASLAALVVLGLESPVLLLALLWMIPVVWNCFRLVVADDGGRGNLCLKTDMVISSGFIATVLFLVAPAWTSVITIGAGMLVIVGSDWLKVDSRRAVDVATAPAQT